MKKIKIGIIGFGTVGSSVLKLINKSKQLIRERCGLDLEIVGISDVSPKIKHHLLIKDAYKLINDPEISIIVEAIGGVKPALDFILAAIKKGKHVITSNKEVIALYGDKIKSDAEEKNVCVKFEASVGGGIPIIGPLSHDLMANQVTEVYGIVNGTTNYILSKMSDENIGFAEALKEAQEKGFAEANPKKDIDGFDASYKAAILASVAFRKKVNWKDIYFEGISKISQEDICYADEIGYAIKLLAVAKDSTSSIDVRVHPTLVPKDHPLASVKGPMNAIYVKGDSVGELMFYGQGAGGMPTASAVVSDIIETANYKKYEMRHNPQPSKIKPIGDIISKYYIRLKAPDKHGVLAQISKAFADRAVSIAAVMQKETIGKTATIVILTDYAPEKALKKTIDAIKKLPVVREVSNIIRVGL